MRKPSLYVSDEVDNPKPTAEDFEAFAQITAALKRIRFQQMPRHTTREHWEAYKKTMGQMYVVMRQYLYPPEPAKPKPNRILLSAALAGIGSIR